MSLLSVAERETKNQKPGNRTATKGKGAQSITVSVRLWRYPRFYVLISLEQNREHCIWRSWFFKHWLVWIAKYPRNNSSGLRESSTMYHYRIIIVSRYEYAQYEYWCKFSTIPAAITTLELNTYAFTFALKLQLRSANHKPHSLDWQLKPTSHKCPNQCTNWA